MTKKSIQHIDTHLPISFPYIFGEDIKDIYPDVKLSIERITPETAKKMLKTNIGNRNPKREPLVQAIEKGQWALNGATIVFDENGNLVDGQNRLMACVNANKPIDTIVARGIKRKAQITMDTGVKRVLNDWLTLAGYPDANVVGTIGRMLYRADTYGLSKSFSLPVSCKDTVQTLFEYCCDNYETRIAPLTTICKNVQRAYSDGNRGGLNNGTIGALFDVFRRAGDDNLDEFVGQLLNRRTACTSVRLLQNTLNKNANSKVGKLPQIVLAAYIIKAWNAYMSGDDIKQLKYTQGGAHPESFPEVFLGYE